MKINALAHLQPEVDYQALMSQMLGESHPRRKLKSLQDQGHLTRLKKGFYVLSRDIVGREPSLEIIANLLYGPSYISLESALSIYGLIPERVEEFTSITTQKNKNFVTPLGRFSYRHLQVGLYALGVTIQKTPEARSFLIATPEKALMDIFSLRFKNSSAPSAKEILPALRDDLRIDFAALLKVVDRDRLLSLKPFYKNRRWNCLVINQVLEAL
jgi:hypothetical protein